MSNFDLCPSQVSHLIFMRFGDLTYLPVTLSSGTEGRLIPDSIFNQLINLKI